MEREKHHGGLMTVSGSLKGGSWRLNLALFLDCGPGLKFGKGGLQPKLGLTGQEG